MKYSLARKEDNLCGNVLYVRRAMMIAVPIVACFIAFIVFFSTFIKRLDGQNVTTDARTIQGCDKFNSVHITPSSTHKQDYDENILVLQDQAMSEFDSAYSVTAIRTAEPTAMPTPTPNITDVPTAIPVGSVNIDITPSKSDNGTMVVVYKDDLRLSWYANNAYYYDVSLQKSTGELIGGFPNTTETYLDITPGNLSIGSYVLFVTAYNSSGIAGSTEKLRFDIVSTNTHIELSDYLGTSLIVLYTILTA